MKQVVNYHIKLNYPKLKFVYASRELTDRKRENNNFWIFARCDWIVSIGWIKHLYLLHSRITADDADSIAYILDQLETLKFCRVEIDGDFYDTILIHCKRLEFLGVNSSHEQFIGIDNEWLLRTYPTLEHFEIQIHRTLGLEMHREADESIGIPSTKPQHSIHFNECQIFCETMPTNARNAYPTWSLMFMLSQWKRFEFDLWPSKWIVHTWDL